MSAPATTPPALADSAEPPATRHVLVALSGLLMALFVAILSSTIVSNALPRILADLGGTQAQYTWVVTASLLAMTASTPIWGKLADLFSKKLLVQIAITMFIVGSMLCGLTTSTEMLIGFRVIQGLGMGGLMALAQVVIAAIIPPRERGRYSGYLGAIMAVATVGGPLIGGVIVDTIGWRWCFYVTVPIAVVALVVLQRTLSVPTVKREVHIDYLGAVLIAAGVSALLIWTSLAGHQFAWGSWTSVAWVGGGILALVAAVVVESKVREPIVPLHLFRNPTVALATIAGLFVGVAMFGSTVYLSQFFQLARGATATEAGLLTLPMIAGLFLASTVVGQLISRYGRWKPYLVGGGILLTAGLLLEGLFVSATVPYPLLAVFMAMVGIGVGATQQNLVLAVQNQVAMSEMGAASSTVAFFRSLGGAAGVAALGALLTTQVSSSITAGLANLGIPASATGSSGGQIPNLATLPAPIRTVIENAYGDSIGTLFLVAAPLALLALVAIVFLREVPLRHTIDIESTVTETETGATGADTVRLRRPTLRGIVRHDGEPAPYAVLTVVDADGRQLGRAVAGHDGAYTVDAATPGRPHLLVVQWQGNPHVEALGGATGPQHRDIALTTSSHTGRHSRAEALDAPTVSLGAER
ncbi:EmrB/QacA subfamily drug resistance transporter [Actinomycetospora succinea]|uniref:EmrB/QacA subfamily drug resistance transporter n=1 Tax=Actinomycetospora succinea TaxID=663603 RepID=A0A4R6VPE2_9PSEU|nr:MDR family MFS transporter [Actinomycetospora succinea]TDQ65772.1 EmrB/QacA subfamily drug resistance transporter [Actinomycetospora succinea]